MKTGNTLFAIFLFYLAYKLPAEIIQRVADETLALQITLLMEIPLIATALVFLWTSRQLVYTPPPHRIQFKKDIKSVEKKVDEKTMRNEIDKLFEDKEEKLTGPVQQHL